MVITHPFKSLKNIVLERLNLFDVTECSRLFHGRGGCYPGLEAINVDKFASVLVVIVYQHLTDMHLLEQEMRDLLALSDHATHLAFQYRFVSPAQWYWPDDRIDHCIGTESGCTYQFRFDVQNPGLFLDMAAGRAWVRHHGAGKRIANLFSYTCGFSVVANAAGCAETVNFDMSRSALNIGRGNLRLNQADMSTHKMFSHDILKSLGKITRLSPFDLIIIDPPVRQRSFDPINGYKRLLGRVDQWLDDGGQLLLTMNEPRVSMVEFRELIETVLTDAFVFQRRLAPARFVEEVNADFGLKIALYQKNPPVILTGNTLKGPW